MPSPLTLVFVDYCYTLIALGLHHRCHDVSFCCSLILLFIISPRVCYASSLCLSNTHKHPLLQDHDPLFLPSTRNIQLCLFSKAQFPNKVKLQLQRLSYFTPNMEVLLLPMWSLSIVYRGLTGLEWYSWCWSTITTSADLFLDALLYLGYWNDNFFIPKMLRFSLFVNLSNVHAKIDHVNQRPPFSLTLKTLNTFETLGNVYPWWQPHFKVSN